MENKLPAGTPMPTDAPSSAGNNQVPSPPAPLLRVRGLSKHFTLPGNKQFKALNAVDFELQSSRTLGIVGESGCGKSTLLSILGLLDTPSAGRYHLNGRPVETLAQAERALGHDLEARAAEAALERAWLGDRRLLRLDRL